MPAISVPSPQRQFRRGYVACAHCRAHKVRCVLGTEPPCAKCRREHRECVFNRAKRGPRTREAPRWAGPAQLEDATATGTGSGEQHQATDTNTNHPDIGSESSRDDASASVPERVELTNARRNSSNNAPRLQVPAQSPTSLLERTICPNETLVFFNEPSTSQGDGSAGSATVSPPPIHPNPRKRDEFCKLWHPPVVHELSQVDDEALDVWSKIPYVRLGWFTAREALTYLDL